MFNMKMELTLYDAFKPIYYFSMPFGLTPFWLRSKVIKTNSLITLWNIVLATSTGIISFMAISDRDFKVQGVIFEVTDFMQAWLCSTNMVVTMVLSSAYRNKAS